MKFNLSSTVYFNYYFQDKRVLATGNVNRGYVEN